MAAKRGGYNSSTKLVTKLTPPPRGAAPGAKVAETPNHARLSPSSASRWISCPGSILLSQETPRQPESSYAAEGTAAHALGELKARLAFDMIDSDSYRRQLIQWRKKYDIDEEVEREMNGHTDAYVDLIQERMALYPSSQLMLEQRLDTGIPTCWGTSDAVIVSPVHVESIDFKYGAGIAVEAEDNPQLLLYALGALDTYGDVLGDTEMVYMTIHQPRMGHVLTAEITPDEIRAWRDKVIPIAESALKPGAPFAPSDAACRWCPASGRCRAQLEEVFGTDFDEDPKLLSPDEISDTLGKVKLIRDWLNSFEEAALTVAYSEGKTIPGYKVVLSGGRRVVDDQDSAIAALDLVGFSADTVSKRSILGIGALEKLLGKDQFESLLAPFVRKTEGRPSLVAETDRRPSINPADEAAKVFREEPE